MAQLVENLPAVQETLVGSLSWEVPLEKGQATHSSILGLPWGSDGKESSRNARDLGSVPGLGRSPGGGNGSPLSIFAWRIPWAQEPGGLQSMRSQRFGHNWATKHTQAWDWGPESGWGHQDNSVYMWRFSWVTEKMAAYMKEVCLRTGITIRALWGLKNSLAHGKSIQRCNNTWDARNL